MKKYEAPKTEVMAFDVTDVIQISVATPETLNTNGVNLGSETAANIFN